MNLFFQRISYFRGSNKKNVISLRIKRIKKLVKLKKKSFTLKDLFLVKHCIQTNRLTLQKR